MPIHVLWGLAITLDWQTQKRCSHPSQPARVLKATLQWSALLTNHVKTPQPVLSLLKHDSLTTNRDGN